MTVDLRDIVTGPIEVVGCHAEGEVGDVIVAGVAAPPGDTVWDQSRFDRSRRPTPVAAAATSRAAGSSDTSTCSCPP